MIETKLLEKVVWDSFEKKRKVFPCHTNRASSIGHPCLRFLVFSRTRWADQLLPEVELQFIFNEGNVQEDAVIKTLQEAGFIITEQQRAYFEERQKISGHLDIMIRHENLIPRPIPGEIKGLSQYNWTSINSLEDMVNHRAWYVRKYPAQLMIYMYMNNCEEGLFILKNKQNGRLKFIYVKLDYDYVESLLKKAENVNMMVDSGQDGEPIDDLDCCSSCQFRHICFKEQTFGSGVIILDDDKIASRINRMKSLEQLSREYAKLDEEIKVQIKERLGPCEKSPLSQSVLVGDFVFEGKKVSPKGKNPYWKITRTDLE